MVGQSFTVVSLGEECRAQIPMSTAFPCLVTWMGKRREKKKKDYLQYSPDDYKATSVYFTSSRCQWPTVMWWATSMPPTCHCSLKRESGHSMFSTVERLPWQLLVLISVLQRVRGESLIISAWQRGPTKHKALRSTWEPWLLISSCFAQSCVKVCGGEERSQSVLLSVFIFSSSIWLILSFPVLYFCQPLSLSSSYISKGIFSHLKCYSFPTCATVIFWDYTVILLLDTQDQVSAVNQAALRAKC